MSEPPLPEGPTALECRICGEMTAFDKRLVCESCQNIARCPDHPALAGTVPCEGCGVGRCPICIQDGKCPRCRQPAGTRGTGSLAPTNGPRRGTGSLNPKDAPRRGTGSLDPKHPPRRGGGSLDPKEAPRRGTGALNDDGKRPTPPKGLTARLEAIPRPKLAAGLFATLVGVNLVIGLLMAEPPPSSDEAARQRLTLADGVSRALQARGAKLPNTPAELAQAINATGNDAPRILAAGAPLKADAVVFSASKAGIVLRATLSDGTIFKDQGVPVEVLIRENPSRDADRRPKP